MNFGEYLINISSEIVKFHTCGISCWQTCTRISETHPQKRNLNSGESGWYNHCLWMESSVNSSPGEGQVRCQSGWSLKSDFIHSLGQHQRRSHSATVIKGLGVGQCVNTSLPWWGWPSTCQSNPSLQLWLTMVSIYDCQPVLGNSGDRHSCKKTQPRSGYSCCLLRRLQPLQLTQLSIPRGKPVLCPSPQLSNTYLS